MKITVPVFGVHVAVCALLLCTSPAQSATLTDEQQKLKSTYEGKYLNNPNFTLPPYTAELDSLLNSHKYAKFDERIHQIIANSKNLNDTYQLLNWGILRQVGGGGYTVNSMYYMLMWATAQRMETLKMPQAASFKKAAVGDALYTLAVLYADANTCADQTAVNTHYDRFIENARPIFLYGRTLPETVKSELVKAALLNEEKIAPLRMEDYDLCRGGMDELGYALDHGQTKEGKKDNKTYGKIVEFEGGTGFIPKFRPQKEWGYLRNKQREHINELVASALHVTENKK